MEYDRNNLLNKILEYHFACIELNLYLDNNPNDENALGDYNKYSEKLQRAKENYESKYVMSLENRDKTLMFPLIHFLPFPQPALFHLPILHTC